MPRYWRFAHYPDAAGDTADVVAAHYVSDGVTWDCKCCSEENPVEDRWCWWCKAERGDWLCPCGRRNRKADDECSECGREKPDDE